MPPTRLLPDNSIGTLQPLRLVFANVVLNFQRQYPLISSPVVTIPLLAMGLSLRAHHQFFNQFIGVFPHSCCQD
jgi:hypothetical protein